MELTVEARRRVGPTTVALTVESPDSFEFLPGQFVLVRASPDGEPVARHYTISSPTVTATFELTVRVDPDGTLSPWLAAREPGDTIEVEGPFGTVTYGRRTDAVAVAGGPGIGPALAVAEAALEAGHDAAVIYRDDEPAHRDRLAALERSGVPVTVLEGGDDPTDAIARHVDDGRLYVFGFEPFLRAVAAAIEAAGGDPGEAAFENFG